MTNTVPTQKPFGANHQREGKKAANTIKPKQTLIYRKKYVKGSVHKKGHIKIFKKPGAFLDLSIYVIKKPNQLVRQSP
jgi:hypothetical protein